MIERLKNPWTLTLSLFSIATATVYLLCPMFNIPVFGFENGMDYIEIFWKTGRYMDMITFLMPVIGMVGAVACTLRRSFGPHILSIAFAALPLMFVSYFVISISKYPDIINGTMEKVSMLSVLGWGIWTALATSLVAFFSAVIQVYSEYRSIKNKPI